MGIDTKPNLSNDKFEQFSGETLSLSGCTEIYGIFQIENGASFCMSENAATGRVIISDANGKGTWQDLLIAGGENITKEITQSSHGFDIQDVIGWSGGTYNKPIADGTYDGEVIGIVSCCVDVNTFCLTQAGYVTGLTGLVTNCTYFLSDSTAGLLMVDEPITDGHVSKAVLVANSATSGWVLPYAGYVITTGDTSGGVWGTIVGTLSDQTDLQAALDAKLDVTGLTYTLNSPATCTVGGITPGYVLTGKSLMCILQDAIAPYIVPTFSAFNISGTYPIEVGAALSGTKTFTWTTTTSGNVASNSVGVYDVSGSALLASGLANDGTENIDIGTKTNTTPTTWTWQVTGCSTQNDCFTKNVSKCSIYPYFWGVETCGTRPAVTNELITGGTKVVTAVGTSVEVDFNNVGQWTWIAIQCDYASRTKWISGAAPNCGNIATSPTDKYPDECLISISSGQGCWSSVCYKVYMSGSASTDSLPICFRTY